MYISSFRIENYKSFRATDAVGLTPGFNVIVGQNNVGKTALVEALSLRAQNVPHRSLAALPTALTPLRGDSMVDVTFGLAKAEILELLRDAVPSARFVPQYQGLDAQQTIQVFNEAIAAGIELLGTFQGGGLTLASFVGFDRHRPDNVPAVQFEVGSEGVTQVGGGFQQPGRAACCDFRLASHLQQRIYAFRAERLNVSLFRFGQNIELQPNASNLPEVLDNLQANPDAFEDLNHLFTSIFSTVKRLTVRPTQADQVEIMIWTVPPETRRLDLAMSLTACGTGLGQVLAMLYVVLTAQQPRIFIIDEPQSFLHPGAVRKLIEVFKAHPQHQFIITTHSPTALVAGDPQTLLRLHMEEGQTVIDRLDVERARDLQLVLADVGARLSDVFGADNVLWVEGPTEELCFPKIAAARGQQLRGTVIIGVVQTGDFEGHRSGTTIEIYRRLSASSGLLPPAVGFVFDREGRSEMERQDLERYGNVSFLPRRMYENYLLNAAGIAALASSIQGFRDPPVTRADVDDWLAQHRWDSAFFERLPAERDNSTWLREVRADRILGRLFSELSEQRVQYDKVRHGSALTDWLLEEAPEELEEVAQLISDALARRSE